MKNRAMNRAKDNSWPAKRSAFFWFACLLCLWSNVVIVQALDVTGDQNGIWRKSDSPILVTGDVIIPKGATLTIEPGTLIQFISYWSSIIVRGNLNASGTASLPIVFASVADNNPDQWGGLIFESDSSGTIQFAELRYGGGETEAMIQIAQAQVTVQNTRFRNSGKDGIRIHTIADPQKVVIQLCDFKDNKGDGIECNDASPTITACTFTGNGNAAIWLSGSSFPIFNGDITATTDGIHLRASTFESNGRWMNSGIPYILDGDIIVPTNISLTIDPGVVIKGSIHWNSITVQGQLTIAGETNRPVMLTSLQDDSIAGDTNGDTTNSVPMGNQWGGINFEVGSTGLVQNAEFRYGGGETEAMMHIDQAWVTLSNTTFLNSGEDGIRIHTIANSQQVRILNCNFTGNLEDGIECNDASPTILGCSFTGNGLTATRMTGTSFPDFNGDITAIADGIWIQATTLQQSGHWKYTGVPYILNGDVYVPTNVSLTIDPGVVIKASSYWNSIIVEGQLLVAGSSNRPVVMTSLQDDSIMGDTNGDTTNSFPKGDQWGGIVFSEGATGQVSFAEFRYGGGETEAMIQIDRATVSISNTKFLNSGEDGIRIHTITDPKKVMIQMSDFKGNKEDGIECNNASPTIIACTFSGNGNTAIRLSGTSFPTFNGDLMAITDGIHLRASTFESNGRWEYAGIPYILDGDIIVPTNISLSIDPGVVIKGSSYWNSLTVQGQLTIAGETNRPVMLTSLQDDSIAGDTNGDTNNSVPTGNQWGGIIFEVGSTGLVQNAEFRYGGGETEAMMQIDRAWVTLSNTTFLNSGEDGIRIHTIANSQQVRILNCNFTGNLEDGIECNDASPTILGCSFTGNGLTATRMTGTSFPDFNGDITTIADGIWIQATTLQQSGHWKYTGVPYILNGDVYVPTNVSLTIDPGVVIKASSYWNSIIVEGQLLVAGSSNRPVVMTSLQDDSIMGDTNGDTTNSLPKGDQWGGIVFSEGATGQVSFAEFRYGGGETEAMIQIDKATVSIDHSVFRFSGEDGLRLHNIVDPAMVRVGNSWFVNNQNDGVEANSSSPTIQACHFADNGGGGIWLTGTSFPEFSGDLTSDREGIWLNAVTFASGGTYKYAGIPYILNGDLMVPKEYRLRIEPGVIFKGNNYWNSIFIEGQLDAVGTSERPIWFTSYQDDLDGDTNQDAQNDKPATPKGNDWGGIVFQNSGSGTLTYVHLRYGGGESVGLIDIDNGQVNLSQCHLTDSGENGIYFKSYDLAGDPPAIHRCNISGNREYGIRNVSGKQLDATQVWWGDAFGPYHASLNPNGLGNPVTDNVLFMPYLTSPISTVVAPFITQHPKSQTVTVDQTVLLTVMAEGTWPLTYQWFKGTNMIIGVNSAGMEIRAVEMADAGDYHVRVKNEVSEATSQTATLTVLTDIPVTEPIRITSIKVVQDRIELQWAGGKAPFAILNSPKIAEGNWQSVMETNERHVSIAKGDGALFFLIQQK